MKRKKGYISILLAAAAGLVLLQAGTLVSYADSFFVDGDFRFAVTSGERLWAAKYLGESNSVELPATVNGRAVTGVYKSCFENSSVASVTIPEGYTSVGDFAFSGCESLGTVTLPSTLENIGTMAFYGCTSLDNIDFLASGIRTISFAAFSSCTSIESVQLPDTLTFLDENAFSGCESLSELRLSRSLSTVSDYAFSGCTELTYVDIPASVEAIGAGAFQNTALDGVYVPGSVTAIGTDAFVPNNSIVCFADTAASRYCEEYGAENAVILEMLYGDANCDGYVNINDVTSIQRYLADIEQLAPYEFILADVNKDGLVSVEDATQIQMFLAEYDVTLG